MVKVIKCEGIYMRGVDILIRPVLAARNGQANINCVVSTKLNWGVGLPHVSAPHCVKTILYKNNSDETRRSGGLYVIAEFNMNYF